MPYRFSFDLSSISKFFFKELAKIANEKNMHKKLGMAAVELVEKLKIREATGLDVSDALLLLEDFVDLQVRNLSERERFVKTKKRALFLPHCARKYMDARCKASFNSKIPSYFCAHCSPDCLINQATILGEKKEYDVYVLPGGSCVPRILKNRAYEGVVGVACGEELKLGGSYLEKNGIPGQAVPLIKNGCANTKFSIESLKRVL